MTKDRGTEIGRGVRWLSRWSGRALLIAAMAVLLGLVVSVVWSILLPVLLALLLAAFLEPPVRWLQRRLHFPPILAAAAVLIGSIGALVLLGFLIAPLVSGQSSDIVDGAAAGLQKIQDYVQKSDFVTSNQIDNAIQTLQNRLSSSGGAIASGVLSGVGVATSYLVTLVLTLILTFLFLKDGEKFTPFVRRVAGERAGAHIAEVLTRAWATLGGYIRTQAIVSAIDAVLIGTGLLVVGVPLAVPLAILTFAGGFVPIVGAFIAGVLAVLVALVSSGPTGALIILVVVLAVQQLEGNVLSPWLQSRSMNLPSVVVLLSVTLGSTLFGIAGAFLAVPAAAVAAVVLRYLDECLPGPPVPAPGSPADPHGPDVAGGAATGQVVKVAQAASSHGSPTATGPATGPATDTGATDIAD